MSKAILIIILFVLIVLVLMGFFYLFGLSSKKISSTETTFETQGMKVTITKEGSGVGAKSGDRILVHYNGYLGDKVGGTKFDSSYDKDAPFLLTLGSHQVIPGWEIGLPGMKVGEKRILVIPSELAYGAAGYPPIIPQNSWLTFEVEMMQIN